MPVDHEEFASNVQIRQLTIDDFDRLVELQLICFPGMKPWRKEQIESQLQTFPEGQIGVEVDGVLVASASSLIVSSADYTDWHDWMSLADGGMIRNHDPLGDTLYGIEIMVHPEFRGLRLARRLYDARKDLCRRVAERHVFEPPIDG
jgi:ribosomal protein S18 acetylase RimI-like enzyme